MISGRIRIFSGQDHMTGSCNHPGYVDDRSPLAYCLQRSNPLLSLHGTEQFSSVYQHGGACHKAEPIAYHTGHVSGQFFSMPRINCSMNCIWENS